MADEAQVKVRLDADDKASAKIAGVGSSLDKLQSGAGKAMNVVKGFGLAFAGVATAVGAFAVSSVNKFSEVGDAVEKMSKRTGLAAESVSALKVAADSSGTSIESVEMAVKNMQLRMGDLSSKTAPALVTQLGSLGISLSELRAMSPEAQFEALGNAVATVADPAERTRLAFDAFGKSGTDLLPLFESGKFSMEEWSKKAKELGVSFDDLAASNAAKLNDALGEMKAAFAGVGLAVGSALAPKFVELVEKIKPFIALASEFLANNLPVWIDMGIEAFGRLVQFLTSVKDAFWGVIQVIQGFINQMQEFGVIGAIWDALRAAVANVSKVFKENLWPSLQNVFNALEPYIPALKAIAQLFGIVLLGALIATIKTIEVMLVVLAKLTAFLADALTIALDTAIQWWDKLAAAVDRVVGYFRSAYEWAQKAASAAKGVIGGAVGGVGKALGFAEGGIVPGPIGAPVPAIVHGGEEVIPNGRRGGGGSGVSMVFQSPVFLDSFAADRFVEIVMQKLKNEVRV